MRVCMRVYVCVRVCKVCECVYVYARMQCVCMYVCVCARAQSGCVRCVNVCLYRAGMQCELLQS